MVAQPNYGLSTDATLGGESPSDIICPSEKAIKTYIDGLISSLQGSMQTTSNLVTELSGSSTDTEYPSAKLVYDELGEKQSTLESGVNIKTINSTSIVGSGNVDTTQVIIRDWDNSSQSS